MQLQRVVAQRNQALRRQWVQTADNPVSIAKMRVSEAPAQGDRGVLVGLRTEPRLVQIQSRWLRFRVRAAG